MERVAKQSTEKITERLWEVKVVSISGPAMINPKPLLAQALLLVYSHIGWR
jgi:hypothetical protein